MKATEISFFVDKLDASATDDLSRALALEFDRTSFSITSSRGMDGVSEIVLLVSAWGALTVKHLASVLIAWIQRNDNKVIDLKKMTFRGYAARDLERILNSPDNSEDENKS